MSQLHIDGERCTLCGSCIDDCAFGALAISGDRVVVNDDCRLCGSCVEACPQEAICMDAAEVSGADLSAYRDVLVFVEQRDGIVHPVSYEMIGKGLELAGALNQKLCCVIAGEGIAEQATHLLRYGVDDVYAFDQPALRHFRAEPYTAVLCALAAEIKPNILLIGATQLGRSLAPRVATRLRTGLTADCTSLDVRDNGDLVQTRPAFGGNVMARILTPNHRPQMATVRYRVMERASAVEAAHGRVHRRQLSDDALLSGVEIVDVVRTAQADSISDADVIVAAGRGAASSRGMALVSQVAQRLGGTVAGSRPLVEQGLITHAQQVGLSGRTVRPRLYLACGISGAVQHVAGMRGADTIVAINHDPNAPIFAVAHVAIVGDLYDILPRMLEELGGLDTHDTSAAS